MAKRRSVKWLVKAVLKGEWTLDAAIEEHLHENYHGRSRRPPYSKLNLILCYWNMGWRDRVLDIWGKSTSVGEVIGEFGLEPFARLFDRKEKARIQMGDLVTYQEKVYQMLGRREVWPFAGRHTDTFEVFIEQLDGNSSGFVGENSVERLESGEDRGVRK
jgi:hypothetical protein